MIKDMEIEILKRKKYTCEFEIANKKKDKEHPGDLKPCGKPAVVSVLYQNRIYKLCDSCLKLSYSKIEKKEYRDFDLFADLPQTKKQKKDSHKNKRKRRLEALLKTIPDEKIDKVIDEFERVIEIHYNLITNIKNYGRINLDELPDELCEIYEAVGPDGLWNILEHFPQGGTVYFRKQLWFDVQHENIYFEWADENKNYKELAIKYDYSEKYIPQIIEKIRKEIHSGKRKRRKIPLH